MFTYLMKRKMSVKATMSISSVLKTVTNNLYIFTNHKKKKQKNTGIYHNNIEWNLRVDGSF